MARDEVEIAVLKEEHRLMARRLRLKMMTAPWKVNLVPTEIISDREVKEK